MKITRLLCFQYFFSFFSVKVIIEFEVFMFAVNGFMKWVFK